MQLTVRHSFLSDHGFCSDFENVYDSLTRLYIRDELIKIFISVSSCSMRPDSGYPTPCRTLRRCSMWTTSLTCWNLVLVKTQVRNFIQFVICMLYSIWLLCENYSQGPTKKVGSLYQTDRSAVHHKTKWRLPRTSDVFNLAVITYVKDIKY